MKTIIKTALRSASPRLFHEVKLAKFARTRLPREFFEHMQNLSEGDLTIDLGANVGLVSECLARRGAEVIAFEPSAHAFAKLQHVADKFSNITAYKAAVGTADRKTRLYLHPEQGKAEGDYSQSSSLMGEKPNVSKDNFEEIEEIDFARFLIGLDRDVELIKIDIEGYEIALVNHLLDTNALGRVGKVYVETHERKFTSLLEDTLKLKARIEAEGLEDKFFYDWH